MLESYEIGMYMDETNMLYQECGIPHSTHVNIPSPIIWPNLVSHMAKTLQSHIHLSLYHRWDHFHNGNKSYPIFIFQPR
jgi:hypothetical protein